MSAIGDYIHYTADGYQKYGISKGPSVDKQIDYKSIHNRILNKVKYSQIQDKTNLQDLVNKVLSPQDNSGSIESSVQQAVEKLLRDKFTESLGRINWETGNVTAGKVNQDKNKTLNKLTTEANQEKIYLSTILKRLRALEDARDLIPQIKKKEELNKEINRIYRELNSILLDGKKIGLISDLRAATDQLDKLYNNSKLENFRTLAKSDKTNNLITDINKIIKTYAAVPAINLQKGDLFEYVIALAPVVAKENGKKALKQALKDFDKTVIGTTGRSKITIDFSNFSKELDLDALKINKYYISNGANRTAVSFGTSQEKIDVNLEWEGSIVPISAKNVNLKSPSGIHILSGSSLLYLIQDEQPDFVNHYLNIVAQHGTINNGKHVDNSGSLHQNYQEMHDTMKKIILFKALTGETYGRNSADIFFVNDNSQPGGAKIYEMKDLLTKAFENINLYTSITANKRSLETMSIRNDWEDTYSMRLTKFVSRVHDQKISASLKPSLLKP